MRRIRLPRHRARTLPPNVNVRRLRPAPAPKPSPPVNLYTASRTWNALLEILDFLDAMEEARR